MRKYIDIVNEYADPDKRQNGTFFQGSAHYAPNSLWERPGFKEWFAGSRVCAPNGEPLVAFHGSFESFSEFKLQSEKRRAYGFNRLGFWFDIDPRTPEYFSGHGDPDLMTNDRSRAVGSVMPCVLSIKKPFHLDSEFIYTPDIEELRDLSKHYDELVNALNSASEDKYGNYVNRETREPIYVRGELLTYNLRRDINRRYDDKRAEIMAYENESSPRIDGFHELMKLLPRGAKSSDQEVDDFRNQLIAEGHDGIYLGDTAADFKTRDFASTDWWIAFHPNQIKSVFAQSFSSSPNIME